MIDQAVSGRPALTLFEFNGLIKSAIADTLPGTYWVVAEIADIKQNQKGHCYLELVEKNEKATIAQIRANIWVYEFRAISSRFRKATNEPLRQGMKVLVLASASFHEVYGLSLNIKDIDPAYTMGEMARRKKEVLERLTKEGLIEKNRTLELPLVPQRVAVISSPTAAGYGDFFNHLDNNPYGYRFVHTLFPALMQGNEAEKSVIEALNDIRKKKDLFDLAVIIRGGGSVIDLSCFDGYNLASRVAAFPLPVITGIGHEKDDTVVDIVAHTRMKTPTAVAEFLIAGARGFEETILGLQSRLISCSEREMKAQRLLINTLSQKILFVPSRLTMAHRNRLSIIRKDIAGQARHRLMAEKNCLAALEQALRHLDPVNILKRGYSITTRRGKIIKDASLLREGMEIQTRLYEGTATSIIRGAKEVKTGGKVKRDYLLPGFE